LRYVWAWPGLLIILVVAAVLNFLVTPAFSLMPLLVLKHFGGNALQLGGIDSAIGVGTVIGGLILGVWGGFRRRMLTSIVGLIGMGVGFVLVGAAPATAFVLALAGTWIVGASMPIVNGPIFAVVQASVEPAMQGRIFTVMQSAATAMSPLSLAVAGPVADAVGVRAWYVAAGAVCVLMACGAFFVPAIMNLGPRDEPAAAETPA